MVELRFERLLAFSRRLQRVSTFFELLDAARDEAREAVGYEHAWLMVSDKDDCEEFRLLDVVGGQHDLAWEVCPVLRVKGDAFLEAVVASDLPIVIPDARLDPRTNKDIVEKLQNRTIVDIPLRLVGTSFKVLRKPYDPDQMLRAVRDALDGTGPDSSRS